jgi:hypothetical protein
VLLIAKHVKVKSFSCLGVIWKFGLFSFMVITFFLFVLWRERFYEGIVRSLDSEPVMGR